MPTRAFGAPQTICNVSPPALTLQTRRRSASGCCAASKISATTTCVNGGAKGRVSSTSRPAMVKACDNCSVVISGLTYCLSQDSENCMMVAQSELSWKLR